ncbi:MAG: polysaccharide deacetylase family protein [Chloroflexi bacterium]|nr:polysaccharide deacetylase family protein [Chloroflexota bacterium]
MINALSIDLEPWYVSEFLAKYLPQDRDDQIEDSVRPVLELLEKNNTKATFFVLGTVAEKYPELVREIYERGHEVASHGYSHKMLRALGEAGLEQEIIKSTELLKNITGERPLGFRAPSFSLDNSTRWALRILKNHGFEYDSSIFPVKTPLYGVPGAPVYPYRPSMEDIGREDPGGPIIEFPMTVFRFGANIPVSGGFYLRSLPFWFLKYAIRSVNKKRPAIIYAHPWEMYPRTPRLNVTPFSRFVTYHGMGSALRKLEALLTEFKFEPIRTMLGTASFAMSSPRQGNR